MENIFIKNPVVIKEVKQNFEVLEKFKAGKEQIKEINNSLINEIQKEQDTIKEAEGLLNALVKEKEDLQTLITRGNGGLTIKLLDTQRKVNKQQKEIIEAKERLEEVNGLQDEQIKHLECSLYDEFIENRELRKEFTSNAEALQLQYYSLLYKAFEVVESLKDLEKTYYNTVDHSFSHAYPYKGFTDTFSCLPFVNEVKNNFPQPCLHLNGYNVENVTRFTKKFDNIEDNKAFTLYK